jgi:formylglycine-generating enzyme required for sulfatase activity
MKNTAPTLPLAPCCVPTISRARILETSHRESQERLRVTRGSAADMVKLESARFLMGTEIAEGFAADGEGPVRSIQLDAFYIDRFPVTNERFAEFTQATGYITEAERYAWSFVFAGQLPDVDSGAESPANLPWWRKVDGATWRNPEGPDSSTASRLDHPAVHVSWNDAAAYAEWVGKRLPTEAEWEFAARGELEQKLYPWGDELTPDGKHLCNIWQGEFPNVNTAEDGYSFTSPIDAYPANGFDLLTITGNVWEWCSDWFSRDYHLVATRNNPLGPSTGQAKVMKGGSYLCHASYCNRYRVAARTSNTPDSSTSNIGFRCVRDI